MDVLSTERSLAKYLPFLDYIVEKTQHKFKAKYDRMRQWIRENKKFPEDFSKKIEKSIIVVYQEVSNTKNFPVALQKLFTVDLCCSDDEDVSTAAQSTSVRSSKPSNDDVIMVISEDEDEIDCSVELINRITQAVTAVAQIDKRQLQDNYTSAPLSPLIEFAVSKSTPLPLDEKNNLIFFRHGDLAVTVTDSAKELEKDIYASTVHKKKKKHKKEKRNKEKSAKKKRRDIVVDLSSDVEDSIPEVLEKSAETLIDLVTPSASEVNKEKLSKFEELNQKSYSELLAIQGELLAKVGFRLVDESSELSNSLSSKNSMQQSAITQNSVLNPDIDIPTFELSTSNELIRERQNYSLTSQLPIKNINFNTNLPAPQYPLRPQQLTRLQHEPLSSLQHSHQLTPQLPINHRPPQALLQHSYELSKSIEMASERQIYSAISKPNIDTSLSSRQYPPQPQCLPQSSLQHQYSPQPQCLPQSSLQHSYDYTSQPNRMQFCANPPMVTVPMPNIPTTPAPLLIPVPPPQFTANAQFPLALLSSPPLPVSPPNQIKDPRLRKRITVGQYALNRVPVAVPSCTVPKPSHMLQRSKPHTQSVANVSACPPVFQSGNSTMQATNDIHPVQKEAQLGAVTEKTSYTKSSVTYGEHRKNKEKLLLNEGKKRRKVEEAKLRKEQELRRQTELIRQILGKHQSDIVNILSEDLNPTKTKNYIYRNKATEINNTLKKSPPKQPNKGERSPFVKKNSVLKQLECSVKGYDTLQDFLPATIAGKRRSSISARKAIAEHLSITEEGNKISDESTIASKRNKRLSSTTCEDVINKRTKTEMAGNKTLPKMKRCRVVLTRMSKSEILKLSKNEQVLRESRQNIILTKSFDKNYEIKQNINKPTAKASVVVHKSTSKPIKILNVDCCMTERNCKTCVLCQKRPENLTNHFIRFHKIESYVSRLTWEELDELQLEVPFAEAVTKKLGDREVQQFKVKCPFCPSDNSKTASFQNLRRHYSTHTGEYAYACKGCNLKKPFRDEIKFHQQNKKCADSGVGVLYQYNNDRIIYMYLCNTCNFVQLNKANVFKHLREQHSKSKEDPSDVKELILAALGDEPVERVPLNTLVIPNIQQYSTSDNNVEPERTTTDTEKVLVSNEPLIDDYVDSIIKIEADLAIDFEIEQDQKNSNITDENEFMLETSKSSSSSKNNSSSQKKSAQNLIAETLSTTNLPVTSEVDLKPATESTLIEKTHGLQFLGKPNAVELLFELVKKLLLNYTTHTGIRPEFLHLCPEKHCGVFFPRYSLWLEHMKSHHNSIIATCPHCNVPGKSANNIVLPVQDFEAHFKTHCVRLYLCFYCDTRCIDEHELNEHAMITHPEISQVHIEPIPYSLTYTFYILIEKKLLTERLEFLMKLNEVFKERVKHINKMDATDQNSQTQECPEGQIFEEKPNAEIILLETVKALLRKYTANTGIRPELLHQCPVNNCDDFFSRFSLWLEHMKSLHNSLLATCPHCKEKNIELPVEDFEKHFKTHCMRLYLCFHCNTNCIDECELKQHVLTKHPEISKLRIEHIPYNVTYTFYIIIDETLLTDRLEFLFKLNEVFRERVQHNDANADFTEISNNTWTVSGNPLWLENLQLPVYRSNISISNCLLSGCDKAFNAQDQLLDHLYTHVVPLGTQFQCQICKYKTVSLSWKSLIEHMFLHSERIFVCCVCSYYTCDRRNMFQHVCGLHDRRDVPLLRLHRSKKAITFELEFIFAAGTRTFTTTKNCFCGCGANNLSVDSFVSHLRRVHALKLCYFCEHCHEHLPHLQLSDEHHRAKHADCKELKIRCQIAADKERQINVISILPLQIRLNDENYDDDYQGSINDKSPSKSVSMGNSLIQKKKEDEDGLIIMEEDEIVAEDEVKNVQKASNESGEHPSIICTNIFKLTANLF